MSVEATTCFSSSVLDIAHLHQLDDSELIEQSGDIPAGARADELTLNRFSDEDLMSQVRDGDKEALTILFRRYARSVFHVGNRILRDAAEAEDLLQDVFVFVSQRASFFDPAKGSAISWVIQIACHRSLDRRRYLNTRNHYHVEEFRDDVLYRPHQESTVNGIGCRELLNKFRDELTPDQRQTLELHFFEGYTFHEIAGKTGQTLGNVRHHHYRGLERLRALVLPRKRD
ncbi:RNA polymerase sigma factor [Terriglobus sp. ADX1]|uniref:RNA polymerase sigma factor n=1 Tax=Terriglobus sp. ADX1 TaxID=2794063 RepID=UPI002FE60720